MATTGPKRTGLIPPAPDPRPISAEQLRLAELNEGYRDRPYKDSLGNLTIGIGWNLGANPLSRAAAQFICKEQLETAYAQLLRMDPWVLWLDPVRQAAVTDLVFNMGIGEWQSFRLTRQAGMAGDFELMAERLKQSKWYTQVGNRGPRICEMIKTGKWPWDSA